MVTFFKNDTIPSCSNCRYATEYIPTYSYPYSDPYCSECHGKCMVDKVCEDYKLINTYFCHECVYFKDNCCEKKHLDVDEDDDSCLYFIKDGVGL